MIKPTDTCTAERANELARGLGDWLVEHQVQEYEFAVAVASIVAASNINPDMFCAGLRSLVEMFSQSAGTIETRGAVYPAGHRGDA